MQQHSLWDSEKNKRTKIFYTKKKLEMRVSGKGRKEVDCMDVCVCASNAELENGNELCKT